MNDNTLIAALEQLDKNGNMLVHKLVMPSDGTVSYRIYNRPVVISPSMPNIGAAANPVLFYDPRYFLVRSVPSFTYVQRFDQALQFALSGEVAFQMFARYDSGMLPINAAQPSACIIQNHS